MAVEKWTTSEIYALVEAFQQQPFESGLRKFLEDRARFESERCLALMREIPAKAEPAARHAARESVYADLLRDVVEELNQFTPGPTGA